MAEILPWIATVATIIGAFLTAANLGARVTGSGFAVFLAGSLAWLATGLPFEHEEDKVHYLEGFRRAGLR